MLRDRLNCRSRSSVREKHPSLSNPGTNREDADPAKIHARFDAGASAPHHPFLDPPSTRKSCPYILPFDHNLDLDNFSTWDFIKMGV